MSFEGFEAPEANGVTAQDVRREAERILERSTAQLGKLDRIKESVDSAIEASLTVQLGGSPYRDMPDAELAKQKPGHPVSHPPHYTSHPSGIECIEITRHMNFNLGSAVKYIWRHGNKGKPIQDLQKAVWLIQDEIKRITDAEIKRAEERGETHV